MHFNIIKYYSVNRLLHEYGKIIVNNSLLVNFKDTTFYNSKLLEVLLDKIAALVTIYWLLDHA